jgi:hypothetical protein
MPAPRRPRPGKAGAGIGSRWLARLDSTAAISASDASSAARPNDGTARIASQRPGTEVTRHRGTRRKSTELFDLALTDWLISRLRQPRRIGRLPKRPHPPTPRAPGLIAHLACRTETGQRYLAVWGDSTMAAAVAVLNSVRMLTGQ